ncbi:MAG: acyl-CoA dehydrogenase family protein, partial [Chloroflexota bacterium]
MQEPTERTQDRLYHGLGLPPEADDIRARVREFAAGEVARAVAEMEERAETVENFPRELFQRMARLGLFRIPFAVAEGGTGLSSPMLATAIVMEELAYESNSLAVIYDCQCVLAGRVLQYASEELKATYLPSVMSGERIACVAITEPDAGSDVSPRSVATIARPVEGGWSLSGHKRFIINAPLADVACILCTIEDSLSMLVVDMHANGVSVPSP